MNIRKQYAILSAEWHTNGSNTDELNAIRTRELSAMLENEGLDFIPCKGVYEGGQIERGFYVSFETPAILEKLQSIAFWHYLQESILYSDSAGKISLIFADGRRENLPDMRRVKSKEGLKNYTVINSQIITTEAQS